MIAWPRSDSSKKITRFVPRRNSGTQDRAVTNTATRRTAMDIVFIGLGIMLGIWILVIWGSNLFNKNMQ